MIATYKTTFFHAIKFSAVSILILALAFSPLVNLFNESRLQTALAATVPALLKDINPSNYGSYAWGFVEYEGDVWFSACSDGEQACNLYRTDGTEEGTEMFPIIIDEEVLYDPGAKALTVAGDLLYLSIYFDGEYLLAATDGTDTWIISGIDNLYTYSEMGMEFEGDFYFVNNYEGLRLWKADDSVAVEITGNITSEDYLEIHDLTVVDGELYFIVRVRYEDGYGFSNRYNYEIWRVNGDRDGAELVADFDEFNDRLFALSGLSTMDNILYFIAYDNEEESEGVYLYYITEGEGFGVELVTQLSAQVCGWSGNSSYLGCNSQYPRVFGEINNKMLFMVDNSMGYYRAMASDGTSEGTQPLPASGEEIENVFKVGVDTSGTPDSLWYYTQSDEGSKLHYTDGTDNVSISIPAGWIDYEREYAFAIYNGTPYFQWCIDDHDDDCELWRVNAERDGVELFIDIKEGEDGSYAGNFVSAGGLLYFSAGTTLNGNEAWVSDGTIYGTRMLKDIELTGEGSIDEGMSMATVGDNVFFTPYHPDYGTELWITDGTTSGTRLVRDIYEGQYSSSPYSLTAAGDTLYFTAYNEDNWKLWKSDGTEEGTVSIDDVSLHDYIKMVADGDVLYLSTQSEGVMIYKIENTGTVTTIEASLSHINSPMFVMGGDVYFAGEGGGTKGIFKIENDEATLVHDWSNGGFWGNNLMFGGESALYYAAVDNLVEPNQGGLWRITSSNPVPEFLLDAGVKRGAIVGDKAFLFANGGGGNSILYTALPESELEEITIVPQSYDYLENLTPADEKLYFILNNSGADLGVWVSDGTNAGTMRVYDPKDNSTPNNLFAVGSELYFNGHDDEHGEELWKTDGTVVGTYMVADIRTGTYWEDGDEYPRGSFPQHIALAGTTLVFYAYTHDYGGEPWFIADIFVPGESGGGNSGGGNNNNNNGGGRSSGGASSGRAATAIMAVTNPAILLQQVISEIRSRIEKMIANGETISPSIQAFLNSLDRSASPGIVRDLQYGNQGEDVRMLQNILIAQGYVIPAGATGLFLDQTRAALAAYQVASSINPAMGYFGPLTRAFMKAANIPGLWW